MSSLPLVRTEYLNVSTGTVGPGVKHPSKVSPADGVWSTIPTPNGSP